MNAYDKAIQIAKLADNKKAEDIEIYDVADLTSITEYFVVSRLVEIVVNKI